MSKLVQFIQNVFVPLVTVVTATLVAFLNHSVSEVDRELARVDQELKEQIATVDIAIKRAKDEREQLQTERDFNFKIYDLVQESIEESNQQKQEVAKQFVIVMVDGDLRRRLLGVLEAGGTPSIQRETALVIEQEEMFNAQQADIYTQSKAVVDPFNWEDWDYDIFWCGSSGEEAKTQARLISDQLEREGANGRIRVRELPASVNAKPGYKIRGYAIRRSESETVQANALKALSERVLSAEGFAVVFDLQPTSEQTKWYISAFICP